MGDALDRRLAEAHEVVARHSSGSPHLDREQRRISAPVDDRVAAMAGVLRGLEERGIAVADIALRKPTLDDVFLRLTGHGAEPAEAAQPGDAPTGTADEGDHR